MTWGMSRVKNRCPGLSVIFAIAFAVDCGRARAHARARAPAGPNPREEKQSRDT
jgi:hypothetical protein